MNKEEMRIAVAHSMGWKRGEIGPADDRSFVWLPPNGGWCDYVIENLPPLTLDWLHEVEETLGAIDEQDRYIDALYAIIVAPVEVEFGSVKWTEHGIRWVMLHATAEQRAEAYLRVKNLWRLDE